MKLEKYDLEKLIWPVMQWYEGHHRKLPWRGTKNPYHIWVSEIMLQQTRVEAVKGYYERFLDRLPDIRHLADCPEDVLLKLWEGLGYYNRVKNMQKAARIIRTEYGGVMPASYEDILRLPGIGAYTAGAIASIAFHIPVPAVDGNVLRILCRAAEDDSDIKKDATKKRVTKLLFPLMPKDEPGIFNQALIELGACVCVPNGEPLCDSCPWNGLCLSKMHQTTHLYPVKSKAKERRIEEKTVFVIADGDRIAIEKRPQKGLLAGLYQFPNEDGFFNQKEAVDYIRTLGLDPLHIEALPDAKHVFSHIEWRMKGYLIRVADLAGLKHPHPLLVEKSEIMTSYAIPSAFETYASYVQLSLGKEGFTSLQSPQSPASHL